jgi:hypothetical protein
LDKLILSPDLMIKNNPANIKIFSTIHIVVSTGLILKVSQKNNKNK